MNEKKIAEKPKEEIRIPVPKFTRPEVVEELTEQDIKDVIDGQEREIVNIKKEIERRNSCINHYRKFLK